MGLVTGICATCFTLRAVIVALAAFDEVGHPCSTPKSLAAGSSCCLGSRLQPSSARCSLPKQWHAAKSALHGNSSWTAAALHCDLAVCHCQLSTLHMCSLGPCPCLCKTELCPAPI